MPQSPLQSILVVAQVHSVSLIAYVVPPLVTIILSSDPPLLRTLITSNLINSRMNCSLAPAFGSTSNVIAPDKLSCCPTPPDMAASSMAVVLALSTRSPLCTTAAPVRATSPPVSSMGSLGIAKLLPPIPGIQSGIVKRKLPAVEFHAHEI